MVCSSPYHASCLFQAFSPPSGRLETTPGEVCQGSGTISVDLWPGRVAQRLVISRRRRTLIVEALITKACSQAIHYSLLQSVFHLTVDETVVETGSACNLEVCV